MNYQINNRVVWEHVNIAEKSYTIIRFFVVINEKPNIKKYPTKIVIKSNILLPELLLVF